MMTNTDHALAGLKAPSSKERIAALRKLLAGTPGNDRQRKKPRREVNLHTHTTYSYNPYGYTPAEYAWRAHSYGMSAAGIVDFDVLDGVDEFHEAGAILDLRTIASIESRVFVPEFADKVINSPGEPGIAYHMGAGFVSSDVPSVAADFLRTMCERAEQRTRTLVEKVNRYLAPLKLDYELDVLTLTPQGNATERHVCEAYANKASHLFMGHILHAFWTGKLGALPADIDLPVGPKLQALIRAKTMKRGGVGYVNPEPSSFPLMADMNRFSLQCGAIPTLAWLDGTSDGEQDMERLIHVARASGVAAINIIPDRNFTPGKADQKLQNLYDVCKLANTCGFPVIIGTEMNSPGNRFIDDFAAGELAPLIDTFLRGAFIVYAHTALQRHGGLGYMSDWAIRHFAGQHARNDFFAEVGATISPATESKLGLLHPGIKPDEILRRIKG